MLELKGKKVLVVGLGKSGLAAALFLRRRGAQVTVSDIRSAEALAKDIPALLEAGINVEAGGHGLLTFRRQDLIVVSPGVPLDTPELAQVRNFGLPIIGELELAARFLKGKILAITGSNGKTTTTTLVGEILKEAGFTTLVGGNIGVPVINLIDDSTDDTWSVLEVSSFQLESTEKFHPTISVILNITPDHLDRHGSMDGYVAAKERIFLRQGARHCAVIGADDAICRGILDRLSARHTQKVVPISAEQQVSGGVSAPDCWLVDEMGGTPERILDLRTLERLPGRHNWQNAVAAYAAVRCLGLDKAEAVAGLKSFAGLAHRQELIAVIDGVRYVNDSKATNADATEKALACNDDIYWIAGGVPKEGGIASLASYFPRIRRAYLIGEAAKAFAATIGDRAPAALVGTLDAAIDAAHRDAHAGATVLLSPACASFDQFRDFEARGDAFRAAVTTLAEHPVREAS